MLPAGIPTFLGSLFHDVFGDSWLDNVSQCHFSKHSLLASARAAYEVLGLVPNASSETSSDDAGFIPKKKKVTVLEETQWDTFLPDCTRIEVIGDSLLIVRWCHGL